MYFYILVMFRRMPLIIYLLDEVSLVVSERMFIHVQLGMKSMKLLLQAFKVAVANDFNTRGDIFFWPCGSTVCLCIGLPWEAIFEFRMEKYTRLLQKKSVKVLLQGFQVAIENDFNTLGGL